MTTILEIAGLPVPDCMQGKTLLPLLRDRSVEKHDRNFAQPEYYKALICLTEASLLCTAIVDINWSSTTDTISEALESRDQSS